MRLFHFIYLFVYSLMHIYVIAKAKTAFNLNTKKIFLLIIFSFIMVFTPILIGILNLIGIHITTHQLTYGGFLWMGFMFIFCCLLLSYDVLKLFNSFLLKWHMPRLLPSASIGFSIVFFLSIVLVLYGHFEARNIQIEKITIHTSKIHQSLDKLRIVHISDVHIGPILREKRLNKIVEMIEKLEPDILLATGDIVDGQINNHPELIEPFIQINPRYGKYAVAGNHEFYVGIDQAVDFMQKAGFKVLRGQGITVAGFINIAGVDDPTAKKYSISSIATEKEVLSGLPRDNFTILLKHRPDVKADYLGLFDLQLSGHAHKGQIFPISLITMLYYDVHEGLAYLPNNSYLYVSRGAGTSGPPIRILAPPEIAVIEIISN